MRPYKPMPRRLYFFPALIPLAEMVPWLLTLLAAAAGAAGLVEFLKRHRIRILILSALLLAAAGGIHLYQRPNLELRRTGTFAPAVADYPRAQVFPRESAALPPPSPYFALLWSRHFDKQILASPVLAGGALIYGLYKGGVDAVRPADGASLWSLPTREPVFALTADGDTAYVGEGIHDTAVASLFALDGRQGAVIWQRQFTGHIEETVAIEPQAGRVTLGTGPGGLWSLRRDTGAVIWHRPIGHIDASPLAWNGNLYVPAQPDETREATAFFALRASDGATLWQLALPGMPWGSPVMNAENTIILTSTGSGQIGVTRASDKGWAQGITPDGRVLWQVPLPNMPLQPSVYLPREDIIIHATKAGAIVALHAKDGTTAWTAQAGGELQAPATALADGRLIAATTHDGIFTVRDAATGRERARWTVGKYSTAAPVGAGDIVYVPTAWAIYAFGGVNALAALP